MDVRSTNLQIESVTHSSGNAVTGAPKFMLLGGKVVYVTDNSASSGSNSYITKAHIVDVAKATGEAWAIFAAVYWDNSNSRFTTTSSGNTLAGYAAAVAGSGDTTGSIILNSLP